MRNDPIYKKIIMENIETTETIKDLISVEKFKISFEGIVYKTIENINNKI